MSAAELMADLERQGIRLEACGGRLRYSPKSAMTPELAERMKVHKDELLAILRAAAAALSAEQDDAAVLWQATLDRLEGDPLFPPNLIEALRSAQPRWDGQKILDNMTSIV